MQAHALTVRRHSMDMREIQNRWIQQERDLKASVEMWNSMASQFSQYETPTPMNSSLLKLIEEKKIIDKESRILDVGCGTGKYSFALAKRSKHVIGMDLSPRMIQKALEKKKETKADNVDFHIGDWHTAQIETLGYKSFDLVIAHMTPAVRNYETFMKLSEAGKGYCIMSKPTKRIDPVSDKIRDILHIKEKQASADLDFMYALEILSQQGIRPALHYEEETWDLSKSLSVAFRLYKNRMKSYRKLRKDDEIRIYDYLESISQHGFVKEKVTTTVATMVWNVNQIKESY